MYVIHYYHISLVKIMGHHRVPDFVSKKADVN